MEKHSKKQKLIASGVLAFIILAAVSLSTLPTSAGKVATEVSSTPSATADATPNSPTGSSAVATAATAAASGYKDGSYTASSTYRTPESTESVQVSVIIKNGIVMSSTVSQNPQQRESARYQQDFASGYKAYVDGRKIDSISLDRVSGSSLTSGGFNKALSAIKSQAKA